MNGVHNELVALTLVICLLKLIMSLLSGLHVRRCARQRSLITILSLSDGKAAEKHLSATVVASIRSTGATVVASIRSTGATVVGSVKYD